MEAELINLDCDVSQRKLNFFQNCGTEDVAQDLNLYLVRILMMCVCVWCLWLARHFSLVTDTVFKRLHHSC